MANGKSSLREGCKGWNSPVLLAKKKNGEFRFSIDLRKVNEVTFKINRPLPILGSY